jgi:hypothetical protein
MFMRINPKQPYGRYTLTSQALGVLSASAYLLTR